MPVEKVIMVAQEEFLRKQVAQFLRKKRIDVAECGSIQEAQIISAKVFRFDAAGRIVARW